MNAGHGQQAKLSGQSYFSPVPPPSLPPGQLSAERLGLLLREWASAPPVRALAEASGWAWPEDKDTGSLLARLAELSGDWDFRRQQERNFIKSGEAAVVNGRVIPDDLVTAAARALGLVESGPPPKGRFTAVVVLSGLVTACVNRTRHAAALLREGLDAQTAVVLGGHRELGGSEPDQARDLGFGHLFDEADVVLAATRQAFGLGPPDSAEESAPRPEKWDKSLWGAAAAYRWPGTEVVIAPSGDPASGRANTTDQLRYWAARAGIGTSDRVLLVTSQIYVPYQQFGALRVLGLERGCEVQCSGVDGKTSFLPMRQFGGRDYLQEIRSALRAASDLMAAARQAGH